MAYFASKADKATLSERMDLLTPALEIHLPDDGAAPYPVVLQFHGCAGIRWPFQRQWANVANQQGFAAIIVNSHGPRGYSWQDGLDIVCNGKALLGQERAGDVLAAIEIVKADERFDSDRLILAGWSHGGWTLMDFLTMDMERRRPAGLMGPAPRPPKIAGTILFYPYCGMGTLSRFRNWTQSPPMLGFVAGADLMVDGPQCVEFFKKRTADGAPVEHVFYSDAHHVFDDPYLEPEWIHWYNEDYHRDAEAKVIEFLQSISVRTAR